MSQPRGKSADSTGSAPLRKGKARPGRNDLCVCGSGRKYKKCCGRGSDPPPGKPPQPASPPGQSTPRPTEFGFLEVLVSTHRYAELEETVTRLLADDGANGFLWKVLALALWRQGKDALQALQRAAQLLPDDAEAHSNLGNACRACGQLEEAVRCHRRALSIRPDYAEAHNNLGTALQNLGRTEEALASYRRAAALKSDFAMAHANLGNALRALARPAEAVTSYRQALAVNPNDVEVLSRLGSVRIDLGECEEAVASYRRALEVTPHSAELHCSLGMALLLERQADQAEASCRKALELDPALPSALILLAELRAARGDFAEAQVLLRRAVAIDPESPEGWACLAQYRSAVGGDEAWLAQAQRLLRRQLPVRREARLRYALGSYFDEVGEFAQAFGHYRQANELTKQYAPRYEREQLSRYVDLIAQLYDHDWLSDARLDPAGSERAVFIVGMWRSGTTLAEQILASHPGVFGAGEFAYWNSAAWQYLQALVSGAREAGAARAEPGPAVGRDDVLERLSATYLEHLRHLSAAAPRVVDKMSSNFLHLGLIHACLPNARIIHMRRHPIDTCLSVYFQSFLHSHRYANDLEDLAHYYREYLRVMSHWQKTLPGESMLEISYEGLIEDQESSIRRMLEFIGLPWDPRCLEFHRTDRTVLTSSKWQVRQALNRSSIGRWRNYEPFIAPLLSLAQPVPV